MSRVPYFTEPVAASDVELVERIRARRGGRLLNLDRMLLNSPPFARGWNAHLGAVRGDLSLEPKLRELAVCAVAVLNQAKYEFEQHAPELLRAGGTATQVETLKAFDPEREDSAVFDATERAVLQFTVAMTRDVKVSDATFKRAREVLKDDRQVVELVGVIATYNMVSRFLIALEVDSDSK